MTDPLAMYEKGVITAGHLVVECLLKVDLQDPALVLNRLPLKILIRMIEYANEFQQGPMKSNYGQLPTADQVTAAKKWIEVNVVDLHSVPDNNRGSDISSQLEAYLFTEAEINEMQDAGVTLDDAIKEIEKLNR